MTLQYKIIAALVVIAVIVSGYFYIKSLRSELRVMAEQQKALEYTINQQKLVMESNKKNIDRMVDINKDLANEFRQTQEDVSDLRTKFNKRNIGTVAAKKPSLTEKKINKGTKDALRCNEIITGSPLTESEKSGKIRNSICDRLIRDRIKEEQNAQ